MTDEELQRRDRVRTQFEATLNQHGFGFQYRVVQAAWDFYKEGISSFKFEVAEFPVEVQKIGTRVDFILLRDSRMGPYSTRPLYIIAECKRANPALSDWCFIRAPFTSRKPIPNRIIVDSLQENEEGNFIATSRNVTRSQDDFYHIGIDVRSKKAGDPSGHGRGAIEETATQVLRGLNGFIEFLYQNQMPILAPHGCELLPVIFTTASLWITSTQLVETDIITGNVNIELDSFKQTEWLLFQYHQSPGLKHSAPQKNDAKYIGDLLERKYVRTVPIVSVSGIEQFFRWVTQLDLW